MKKLMILLGTIAMAVGVQAASINWGAAVAIGTEYTPATDQYCYLLYSSSAYSSLASALEVKGCGADAIGGTANNGGEIVAFHKISAEEGENGAFLDTFIRADADGGVNGYYQIIVSSADNKEFAVVNAESAVTGISDTTSAGNAKFNADWSGDGYLGSSGYTGTITAVPEPTSGLLMLVGLAGLALRRRRA